MTGYDALLIDFGGTLALEKTPRARIYQEAARRAGLWIDEEPMAALMGEALAALPKHSPVRYTRPWFELFIERIFGEELGLDGAAIVGVKEELFARFTDPKTFGVFPDARVLLGAARAAQIPVAVVSNWTDTLDALIEGLELGPFGAIASSAALSVEKPDRGIFEWALGRIGVPAERALHVGDSYSNDVVGARALGIEAVLLDRGGASTHPKTEVVRTLDALVDRIFPSGDADGGR